MQLKVYIAGPLSCGEVARNIRAALAAADTVFGMGYIPYVPHLTHFWHLLSPKPYEDWMNLDFAWLACCAYLVRLPGDSPGADREVAFAEVAGVRVFHGLDAFVAHIAAVRSQPPA